MIDDENDEDEDDEDERPKWEQLDFGEALARNEDPDTSHEAADGVQGEISARLQRMLVALLESRPPELGVTSSEAADIYDIPRDSLSPRWKTIREKGLAHDSGERRPGPTGRPQIVWKLGPGINGRVERASRLRLRVKELEAEVDALRLRVAELEAQLP